MTTAVRDKTAKIVRKAKNAVLNVLWMYLSLFLNIFHILWIFISRKYHRFCRKGKHKISEILFVSKYCKNILNLLHKHINHFIIYDNFYSSKMIWIKKLSLGDFNGCFWLWNFKLSLLNPIYNILCNQFDFKSHSSLVYFLFFAFRGAYRRRLASKNTSQYTPIS